MAKKKKSGKNRQRNALAESPSPDFPERFAEGVRQPATPEALAAVRAFALAASHSSQPTVASRGKALLQSGLEDVPAPAFLSATLVSLEEGELYLPKPDCFHLLLEGECIGLSTAAGIRTRMATYPALTSPDIDAPTGGPLLLASRACLLFEVPHPQESFFQEAKETFSDSAGKVTPTSSAEASPRKDETEREASELLLGVSSSSTPKLLWGLLSNVARLVRASGFGRARSKWRFAIVAACFSALFLVLVPLASRYLVDVVILRREIDKAPWVVLAMVSAGGLGVVCALLRDRMLAWLLASFQLLTMVAFAHHVHALPLDALWARGEGRILQLYEEARSLFETLAARVVTLLLGGVQFTLQLLIVALIDVRFLLVVLLLLATAALFVAFASGAASRLAARQREAEETRLQLMHEQLEAQEWLHSTRSLSHAFSRWENASHEATRASARVSFLHAILQHGGHFASRLTGACLLFLGLYLHGLGEVTLGQVVALAFVSDQAFKPAVQWLRDWRSLVEAPVTLSRIAAFFTKPTQAQFTRPSQDTSLRPWEASFVASASSLQVVRCESVAQREHLAYALAFGNVAGEPVGYVSSDVPFFTGTLLENIALGDETPDVERALLALRTCELGGLVQGRVKGGFAAAVKGGSLGLSERERVLFALARLVYRGRSRVVVDGAFDDFDVPAWTRVCARFELVLGRASLCLFTASEWQHEGVAGVVFHEASRFPPPSAPAPDSEGHSAPNS